MVGIRRPQMGKQQVIDTIWEVPDELWEQIKPILRELDPAKGTGRKRTDARRALNGVIFRLRTGCQWNRLPREFGDDSTVHRAFQRWRGRGVLRRVWGMLVEKCVELGGVEWDWQAADAALGKARLGGTRLAPTPRTGARQGANGVSLWKGRVAP
jgi:putative transposase